MRARTEDKRTWECAPEQREAQRDEERDASFVLYVILMRFHGSVKPRLTG